MLNLLLHLLLLSSLVGFGYFLYRVVLESPDRFESLLRTGTALCGLLVILGARLAGLNAAQFTVNSLAEASPLVLTASAAGPGGAGVALGWYLIRRFRQSGAVAKRIMIFVGMIATLEFILIYSETMRQDGLGLGPAVIPNVSFVVGVVLYVALTYDPQRRGTEQKTPGSGIRPWR